MTRREAIEARLAQENERLRSALATLEHQDGMMKASNAENFQKWQASEAHLGQARAALRMVVDAIEPMGEPYPAVTWEAWQRLVTAKEKALVALGASGEGVPRGD